MSRKSSVLTVRSREQAAFYRVIVQIAKRSELHTFKVVMPKRWIVERSFV